MSLAPGSRLGPYEIIAPLGAGGMGEVFRAKDTRLGRDVAIKVLPSHLSDNPDLKARFEREAKAISQLTHPNICTLYDVGSENGIDFLVMELLDGQSLAERLEKGALPTEQVLKFGVQIAEALDRAHRAGIIHRDLKPGNIMLTKSGVKLLDFGLAKVAAATEADSELSSLPTQAAPSQPLTEKGTIMGTFQYMSPEQLEGKSADARTDIFAFGCVLYEMATGKKAFAGGSRASLIGAIMNTEPPPISSIQPMTPPALDHVIRRCLAKDQDERWQSAADVASELAWVGEAGSQAGAPATVVARRKSRERLAWIGFACAGLLAVIFGIGFAVRAPKPAPVIWSSIETPEKLFVNFFALSPDGTRLAMAASTVLGSNSLWVRRLDAAGSDMIPGTEDAIFPFWSPDGQFLAFFADKKLKKVDLSGGPVVTICAAEAAVGGTWGRDGTIVFAPGRSSGLFRVPSSGGVPVPVTKLDLKRNETAHRYPQFLPDGRHFVYMAANLAGAADDPANTIRVGSVDGKEDRQVVAAFANPLYSSGHVLYSRQGTLFALPVDSTGMASRGEAVPLAQHLSLSNYAGYTTFTASETGLLVVAPNVAIPSRLTWVDRGGKELGSVGEPDLYGNMRLSPDGKRLAVDILDAPRSRNEIWVVDLASGAKTKLVSGDTQNQSPIWSPDGDRVAFASDRQRSGGNTEIWVKSISGGTEERLLESPDLRTPEDWSRDGRILSFNVTMVGGRRNQQIWFADLSAGKKCTPFQTSALTEGQTRISPDGRWLVYDSDESGKFEIYVVPFPTGAGKWQVSTGGGFLPQWRGDGKEIYFVSTDFKLMAAPVDSGASFHAGTPAPLFAVHPNGSVFEAAADGKRFLVNSTPSDPTSPPLTLIANWPAAIQKKK